MSSADDSSCESLIYNPTNENINQDETCKIPHLNYDVFMAADSKNVASQASNFI